MFSFFAKKEMNLDAARAFWAWFEQQEAWIVERIEKGDSAFVWAIDRGLKPVFPYFKGELEFQLGYHEGMGEFFFFHLGKKELIRDGKTLGELMPPAVATHWKFILER